MTGIPQKNALFSTSRVVNDQDLSYLCDSQGILGVFRISGAKIGDLSSFLPGIASVATRRRLWFEGFRIRFSEFAASFLNRILCLEKPSVRCKKLPYQSGRSNARDRGNMELRSLDQKRIAVVIERQGGTAILRGTAQYEVDEDLGNCLKVRISGEAGDPHFIFPETGEWDFQRDYQYGCDFSIVIRFNGEDESGKSESKSD
jgi:hypothetical protein